MKLGGICSTSNLSYSGRLHKEDILRLPSKQTNKADFYITTKEKPQKHSTFWRNFFTALTFGLTGLYIAHRNNLFNPARKQAKKIVKSQEMIEKVKNFVETAINPETYKRATRKTLELLSNDKSRGDNFTTEAKSIMEKPDIMENLFQKVATKLNDDKVPSSLNDGYTVDVLDKLLVKTEKMLKEIKHNGGNIKGQQDNIITQIFAKNENGSTIVDDLLLEVIGNRSSSTIEGFIQDSLIASKLKGNV